MLFALIVALPKSQPWPSTLAQTRNRFAVMIALHKGITSLKHKHTYRAVYMYTPFFQSQDQAADGRN